jgi:hypothetical protein
MRPGPFASTSDLSGLLDLRCVAIAGGERMFGDADGPWVREKSGGGRRNASCALFLSVCADEALRTFRIAATCKADRLGVKYALVPAWSWLCGEEEGTSDGDDRLIALTDDVAPTCPRGSAWESAVVVLTRCGGSLHAVRFIASSCVSLLCIPTAHSGTAWAATLVPGSSSWSVQSVLSDGTPRRPRSRTCARGKTTRCCDCGRLMAPLVSPISMC